jgi:tRNA(Ile)-lysidine synthase
MIVQQIQSAIETHALIPAGSHLLVGVSGGADSVAMLHALVALSEPLGFRISVAHLNHGIRSEAAEDCRFVKTLCQTLGVPFKEGQADVPALAAAPGVSLEMAARDARYQFFARAAEVLNADAVATAHTRDDQAETVLLKLCRGAGSSGLDGIARNTRIAGLRVIRPLLDVSRADIERFLQKRNLAWRDDATNSDTTLKRNFIRHDVLPLLEQHLNPKVKEALARTAVILTGENALLADLTAEAMDEILDPDGTLRVEALCGRPLALQRRVLRQWLIHRGTPARQMRFDLVERVLALAAATVGTGAVTLTNTREVRREYARLRVVDCATEGADIPQTTLMTPGETGIDSIGLRVVATLRTGFERIPPGPLGQHPAEACIRWDSKIPPVIEVRSWRPGDRISPLGMVGSRKLQDLFVDAKLPRHLRAHIPIFVCGDEILWIPGYRIAQNWAVLDQKQRSLQLRVEVQ